MILHFLLANALATSFYIPPFSDFTRDANLIARGVVNNIHTENSINDAGTKVIYTYAAFDVKDLIKGTLPKSSIQIRKIGGSKDGYSVEIAGSPEFKEGEENVLFLGAEKEDHSYEVQSLELGQYGLREKNGQAELTGGIFNYAKPSDHNLGQIQAENEKIWTVTSLKKLVNDQKQAMPSGAPGKPEPTPSHPALAAEQPAHLHPSPSQIAANEGLSHEKTPASESNHNTVLFSLLAIGILSFLIFFFRKS